MIELVTILALAIFFGITTVVGFVYFLLMGLPLALLFSTPLFLIFTKRERQKNRSQDPDSQTNFFTYSPKSNARPTPVSVMIAGS